MPLYTATDNVSGKTVTFDWHDKNPPTDADMMEVFAAAGKMAPDKSAPVGTDHAANLEAAQRVLAQEAQQMKDARTNGAMGALNLAKQGAIGLGEGVKGTAGLAADIGDVILGGLRNVQTKGISSLSPMETWNNGLPSLTKEATGQRPSEMINQGAERLFGKPAEPEGFYQNLARNTGELAGGAIGFGAPGLLKGGITAARIASMAEPKLAALGGLFGAGANEIAPDSPLFKAGAEITGMMAGGLPATWKTLIKRPSAEQEAGQILSKATQGKESVLGDFDTYLGQPRRIDDIEKAKLFANAKNAINETERQSILKSAGERKSDLIPDPTKAGESVTAELLGGKRASAKKQSAIFESLDPNNEVMVPTGDLIEGAESVVGKANKEWGRLSIAPQAKQILERIAENKKALITFNDLNKLESSLASGISKQLSVQNRDNNAIEGLKSLLESVNRTRAKAQGAGIIPAELAKMHNAVKEGYRIGHVDVFNKGDMGKVLRSGNEVGGGAVDRAKVLDTFFQKGDAGQGAMEQFMKASTPGGEGQSLMRDHISKKAMESAITPNNINIVALDRFMSNHSNAIKSAPEGTVQDLQKLKEEIGLWKSKLDSVGKPIRTGLPGIETQAERLGGETSKTATLASSVVRGTASSTWAVFNIIGRWLGGGVVSAASDKVIAALREARLNPDYANKIIEAGKVPDPKKFQSIMGQIAESAPSIGGAIGVANSSYGRR